MFERVDHAVIAVKNPDAAAGRYETIRGTAASEPNDAPAAGMGVDDLDKPLADLRDKGTRLVGDPGPGNPVKGQVFIHHPATGGVLRQHGRR